MWCRKGAGNRNYRNWEKTLNLSNDPNIENIEYIAQALGELRKAMLFAKENPIISTMYINFIRDMVYSSNPPSFDEAFQTFNQSLEGLLPKVQLKFSAN